MVLTFIDIVLGEIIICSSGPRSEVRGAIPLTGNVGRFNYLLLLFQKQDRSEDQAGVYRVHLPDQFLQWC